uniref:Uncharacterized protein n=1 Tax=Anguilla anguilla TaxID=7936 RepID=A0A0E9RGS5_ANGAN
MFFLKIHKYVICKSHNVSH